MNEVIDKIYRPQYFLNMVNEFGYYQAAKKIASDKNISDGFTNLALKNRLDLSIESLVVEPKYDRIFTSEEIDNLKEKIKIVLIF